MFNSEELRKLPNLITLSRIVVTIGVGILLYIAGERTTSLSAQNVLYILAFILCAYAAISDYLDGYFARKRGECTKTGEMLDPIADKIFAIWVFFFLGVPFWLILVMVTRDVLVGSFFKASGLKTSLLAKWKTAILYLLALITISVKIISPEINLWAFNGETWWHTFTFSHLVLALTIITGIHYTWRATYSKNAS